MSKIDLELHKPPRYEKPVRVQPYLEYLNRKINFLYGILIFGSIVKIILEVYRYVQS